MSIEQAKLCQILCNILSVQYNLLDSFPKDGIVDSNSQSTTTLLPIKDKPNAVEFNRCDQDLQNWFNALPGEAKYNPIQSDVLDETNHGILIHRTMNHLIYFTAVNALHRPRSLYTYTFQKAAADQPMPSPIQVSREKVHNAAAEIVSITRDLYQHGLSQYLPLTGLSALVPAMLTHLVDFQSPDRIVEHRAREAYNDCMLVVEELRDIHAAADVSIEFLMLAARRIMQHSPAETWPRDSQQISVSEDALDTVNLGSPICTAHPPSIDGDQLVNSAFQFEFDLHRDCLGVHSPISPSTNPRGGHSMEPTRITSHEDMLNFGEVGALFWPIDWLNVSG